MYRAEARASKKLKAEKAKKSRLGKIWPYRKGQTGLTSTTALSSTQQAVRRLGLCFDCGKPGHWKGAAECQANVSQNKISIESVVVDQISVAFCSDSKEKSELISPVGRLRGSLDKWKLATDSQYIHSVIEHGYKLLFKKIPDSVILKNNKSARDNMAFVMEEIQMLIEKRVISEVQSTPYVVNPLTVAYNRNGKPRLVLGCRHVNDYLHQFKVKYEDISVAETLFDNNTFMYTFDLKGAYHHIDIFSEHTTYLGFSCIDKGLKKYYVFNQLPFGNKTAGHIFTGPPPLGALEIGGCLRLCGIWVVKVPRNRGDR